jgi:hypothetical protein
VVDMISSDSVSRRACEFDQFLFAPIGEDRNDTPLSVLSALARLDVDPWHEAANLARLPGKTATQRLASLIAALPDGSSQGLDPGTVAVRLIALLPRRDGAIIPLRQTLLGAGLATRFRTVTSVISCLIVVVFVLGILRFNTTRQPPAQVDSAQASAIRTVLPSGGGN